MKVICFYQPEHREKLAGMQARFPLFATIPFPVDPMAVEAALRRALAEPSPRAEAAVI